MNNIQYKNDPKAVVDFKVGDTISTLKDSVEFKGVIKAINGQQLTCEGQFGTFFAWSWQSKKVA